jgi:hypothetical protein
MREYLRSLPVFAGELPTFDPEAVADRPEDQFVAWLRAAVEAGVREPHAMTLSTVGVDGVPSDALHPQSGPGRVLAGGQGPRTRPSAVRPQRRFLDAPIALALISAPSLRQAAGPSGGVW